MSQNQTRSSFVIALAKSASAAGSGERVWVQIMPRGDISGRDGRTWSAQNLQAIIDASLQKARGVDLVIDFDHQTDFAEGNGQPAPAAGWIKALEARQDGIYAAVEWTERAAKMIKSREYRFLSPTFLSNRSTGEVGLILRAALTNNPAMVMKQLAKSNEGKNTMEELQPIAAALGLNDDAELTAILAAIAALMAKADDQSKDTASAYDNVIAEMALERAALQDQRIREKVDLACSRGVFTPAMREWAVSYAKKSEEEFDDFCSRMGAPFAYLLAGSKENLAHQSSFSNERLSEIKRNSGAVSTAQVQIAKQLGISTDDLK